MRYSYIESNQSQTTLLGQLWLVSVIHWPFCPAFLSCLRYMICFFVQINMDGWIRHGLYPRRL